MVEDDKADEEADGVVQEVTKVLLDLGVLRKHIDDILEKSSSKCIEATQGQHTGDKPYECDLCDFYKIMLHMKKHIEDILEKSPTNVGYQRMTFLQCDVIVSSQCTKKSACKLHWSHM